MPVTGNNITCEVAKESILSIQLSLGGLSFCIIAAAPIATPPADAAVSAHRPARVPATIAANSAAKGKVLHTDYFPLAGNAGGQIWINSVQSVFEREPLLDFAYQRVSVVWYTDKVCLVPAALYSRHEGEALLACCGVVACGEDTYVASSPQAEVIAAMYFPRPLCAYLQNRYGTESLSFAHPLLVNLIRPLSSPCVELHADAQTVYLTVRNPALLYAEALPYKTMADLLFALQQVDALFALKRYQILVSGVGACDKQQFLRTYYKHTRIDSKPSLTLTYPLYENH